MNSFSYTKLIIPQKNLESVIFDLIAHVNFVFSFQTNDELKGKKNRSILKLLAAQGLGNNDHLTKKTAYNF